MNILNKKNRFDLYGFPKDFPIDMKNTNISRLNNFNKTKYENIKNSSNKDEKINNNIKMSNNIYLIEDKNSYLNIKDSFINTTMNNKNNKVNLYNSPKLNNKSNKSNIFNKTFKNNNNKYGFNNKNNIYLRYYNDHQKDINDLLSDRSKGNNNDKEEYNNNIIKMDSFADGINDNYNEYQNSGSMKSDDDEEPDPRINFEQINQINKCRPLTSYGGLNARRKNLQSALQRNKNNRPITSYNLNN